ncbi:hypothetical protein QBC37DRAFT_473144 [Rhypophila decipiens]|uniref:Uncharacterized protein n=1 Tax=Rhypophila decipiens TaxID=261697 RepID=A0AAN6Y919_9PEZI|nr:hypothetical protein QBC37DRAFT_473144 [Rhypophila decipiens]
MDFSPGSSHGALHPISHNPQRSDSPLFGTLRHRGGDEAGGRDSSVHDKISQFNTLAMQSKQLERKTADAALKRAMLGREEAETEMRRYREEVRLLKRHIEEGKERERRVGERLETVMENYGRAKETHAHTQALWEKEIRRARKETFKAQSALVKLQEELKSARTTQKSVEDELERERERGKAREQEAFAARYSLVGVQEQLDQALERVKMLEQERDAFKTLAKNEEDVARIAAEGKLPLPPSEGQAADDEFASPKKTSRLSDISIVDVKYSATSEAEIEELTRLWQWEKQRADRAVDHVQFLEVECQLKLCPCSKFRSHLRGSTVKPNSSRKRTSASRIVDAGDMLILSENVSASPTPQPAPKRSKTERLRGEGELRRSAVFIPAEGIFRTITQHEAELAPLRVSVSELPLPSIEHPAEDSASSGASQPPTPAEHMPAVYARTPSVEPPDFAVSAKPPRTSLLSLLDAEHRDRQSIIFNIPTTPGHIVHAQPQAHPIHLEPEIESPPPPSLHNHNQDDDDADTQTTMTTMTTGEYSPTQRLSMGDALSNIPVTTSQSHLPRRTSRAQTEEYQPAQSQHQRDQQEDEEEDLLARSSAILSMSRPHTSATHYSSARTSTSNAIPIGIKKSSTTSTVTTTKVPLREETSDPSMAQRIMKLQRTPSMTRLPGDQPSFDVNNPALTPTMTREQALAQIRERRGRARSVGRGPGTGTAASANSAITPRKRMEGGGLVESRTVSAPAAVPGVSGMRRVRS